MPRKSFKRKAYKPKRKMPGMDTTSNRRSRDFRFKQINKYGVKPEPFPRVLYTRMKFSDRRVMSLSSVSGATAHVYRMNSIYDPSFTFTGTTVVGYSNMNNLYSRYLVTGAKVRVSFTNPTADGSRCGLRLRVYGTNATSGSTTKALTEQPLTYMQGLNNSGKQEKTFNMFIRPWTLMGVSKLEYMANTSRYASLFGANPTASQDAVIDVFAINENQNIDIAYTIQIVYYVQLYDRKALSSSTIA